MPRRTVVLGIDPGRNTGLYCVSIPQRDKALSQFDFHNEARWLGNAVVSLSARPSITKPEAWAEMQERISDAIRGARPNLIVLEYPADGMPKWSGGTARGIDFHMGLFFAFAALAAQAYARNIGGRASTPIALMPVTSSKAKGRVGWMPRVTTQKGNRRVTHTQDRDTTLRQCREIAAATLFNAREGTPPGSDVAHPIATEFSDHELMALGVLTYYVTNRSPSEWGE